MYPDILRIASFDPGKKNFAFYVEDVNIKDLVKYKKKYEKKYELNGTPTDEYKQVIHHTCTCGVSVLMKHLDLTYDCNNSYFDTNCLFNLTEQLDKYISIWDTCHFFVIEKQMSFGKKHNTMALKIAQHCWSYFSFRYSTFKQIIEYPAYYKTQILGATKIKKQLKNGKTKYTSINKPTRKKWCIQQAINILTNRNDKLMLDELYKHHKRDDLSDVICQLQAFKIMAFITEEI
jgi:hypothetical protein